MTQVKYTSRKRLEPGPHEHFWNMLYLWVMGTKLFYIIFYVPFKHRRYTVTVGVGHLKITEHDGDYVDDELFLQVGTFYKY